MIISRRQFLRQALILALGFVLEMFGLKTKKEEPQNYYKFELGRSALKIHPGESFNAAIRWPTNLKSTPMDLKVQVKMSGIMFTNLDGSPVDRMEVDKIMADVMPESEERF